MHDGPMGQIAIHRAAIREVRSNLRKAGGGAIEKLPPGECVLRRGRSVKEFATGWRILLDAAGSTWPVKLLIPKRFPYSLPKVALSGERRFLIWPHVEVDELLCLPSQALRPSKPFEMIDAALAAAAALISDCATSPDLNREFQREFVSYWHQHCPEALPLYSLLSPEGEDREIVFWNGRSFDVVGEDEGQVTAWLKNYGVAEPAAGFTFHRGLFGFLQEPPVPSVYPQAISQFRSWLANEKPNLLESLDRGIVGSAAACVVLAAKIEGAVGLIAVTLAGKKNPKVNGFRPGKAPAEIQQNHWYQNAKLACRAVERVDHSWVHGRGNNADEKILNQKTIAIIGCGALGSFVALKLAQAGVGGFRLIDPQVLAAANVGRHALGIHCVGKYKSVELRSELLRRFPHIRSISAYSKEWGDLSPLEFDEIKKCDLIISATGEWEVDGPLNRWALSLGYSLPILYAWMDEHACAAHALSIVSGQSCFECLVTEGGGIREQEVNWEDDAALMSAEPACGVSYMPFGPVELGNAETLVCDAALDILLGEAVENVEVVYATTTARLASLNGTWTARHMLSRPHGFDGAITFSRPAPARTDCLACGGRK